MRDRLRSYIYIYPEQSEDYPRINDLEGDEKSVYNDADMAAERASAYVRQGFTALKLDPLGPYSVFDPRHLSLEAHDRTGLFLRKIRTAVGDNCDLLVGAHGQVTPLCRYSSSAQIREVLPALAGGAGAACKRGRDGARCCHDFHPDCNRRAIDTKYEFAHVLVRRFASILQFALGSVGGILDAKKIAGMAEAHYAQIAPHLYCGPIEGAANIQLGLCSPNFLIQESIETWGGFHA